MTSQVDRDEFARRLSSVQGAQIASSWCAGHGLVLDIARERDPGAFQPHLCLEWWRLTRADGSALDIEDHMRFDLRVQDAVASLRGATLIQISCSESTHDVSIEVDRGYTIETYADQERRDDDCLWHFADGKTRGKFLIFRSRIELRE